MANVGEKLVLLKEALGVSNSEPSIDDDVIIHGDGIGRDGSSISVGDQVVVVQASLAQGDSGASTEFLAEMPVGKTELGSAVYAGDIYVPLGGGFAGQTSVTTDNVKYNIVADGWVSLAEPSIGQESRCTGLLSDNRIHVAGGELENAATSDLHQSYNPATDSWRTEPDIPLSRGNGNGTAVDGDLYYTHGIDAGNTYTDSAYRYTPGSGWTQVAGSGTPRRLNVDVEFNGKLYSIGGDDGSAGTVFQILQEYDPGFDSWSTLSPLPEPRSTGMAASDDYYLYYAGGYDETETIRDDVFRYDPGSDTWSNVATLPTAITNGAAEVVDGNLYVFGGSDAGGTPVKTVQSIPV